MKRLLRKVFLLSITLLAPIVAHAEFQIPVDLDGSIPMSVKEIGVYAYTSSQTQNVPFLITGSSISRTPGVVGSESVGSSIAVYGVLTTTATVIDTVGFGFVFLRSTNTANNTSELLVPPIVSASTNSNTLVIFDPPIISPDGLSVTVSTGRATVFYRYLGTSTYDGVRIPTDDLQGTKAHDSGWFGVKASSESGPGGINDTNRLGMDSLDFNSNEMLINFVSTSPGATTTPYPSRTMMYGWVAGTGSATSYMVCKDTYSTGSNVESANDLLVPILYNTLSYDTAYRNQTAGVGYRNNIFSFPWPIIARNGLTCSRTMPSTALDRFRVLAKPAGRLR